MTPELERLVKEFAVMDRESSYHRKSAQIARKLTENLFEGVLVQDPYESKKHQLYYTKGDTPFQGLGCIKPALEFLGIHDYDKQMREIAQILDESGGYHDFTYHRNRYGVVLEEDLFPEMSKSERVELFRKQDPRVITFSISIIKYGEGIANYVEHPTDPREKSFELNGIFSGHMVPEPLKSRIMPLIGPIRESFRRSCEGNYSNSDLAVLCLDVTRRMAKITANYMIEKFEKKQ
ncbi:MAG: hypothetical protein WCV90_04075 [Candidatus Woesearchaeota archaeon]|jgi:hypothetical protein